MNEIQFRLSQATVVRARSFAIAVVALAIACAFAWGFGILAALLLSILGSG